jgi:hypothetical protein
MSAGLTKTRSHCLAVFKVSRYVADYATVSSQLHMVESERTLFSMRGDKPKPEKKKLKKAVKK